MAIYARIDNSIVIEMHTLADGVENPAAFLSGLWGGVEADYVATPDPADPAFPQIGWTYDGTNFIPPTAPDPVTPPDALAP